MLEPHTIILEISAGKGSRSNSRPKGRFTGRSRNPNLNLARRDQIAF